MASKLVYAASGAALAGPAGLPEMARQERDPDARVSAIFRGEATGSAPTL